jgi:hypothetical protein
MSLAERTRQAVRDRPFLHDALAAGVCNYTAAARFLDVGDAEPVAAALRRYADDLDPAPGAGDARVTMASGFGRGEPGDPGALLAVGGTALVPDAGSLTAVRVAGEVPPRALELVLGRCRTAGVEVAAAGVAGDTLAVVVPRRDGPDALRRVEGAVQ